MDLQLSDLANIATILGTFVAIASLIYVALQIRQNTLISRGQFWLELEKMFANHDEVHINLRPGGKWSEENSGPETVEDWAKVEDYMGLFEHCEILLEKKLIDWETFRSIFSYRLNNILRNRMIVEAKLVHAKQYWIKFCRLIEKLKIKHPNHIC